MQNQIRLCYKTDEGRERHCSEYTSRHTSPEDGELADSRKAPRSSSGRRLPAFIPQKGISIVKKQKGAVLSLPGKLPAPYKSRDFFVEIWERESAPAELILRKPIA